MANVTIFQAGYKENVVPGEASALLDVRVLPGQRDAVLTRIAELAGAAVTLEIEDEVEAVEAAFDAPIVEAVRRYLPHLIDLVLKEKMNPGKVLDQILPLEQVAEGYRIMDERRAIKTLLTL